MEAVLGADSTEGEGIGREGAANRSWAIFADHRRVWKLCRCQNLAAKARLAEQIRQRPGHDLPGHKAGGEGKTARLQYFHGAELP